MQLDVDKPKIIAADQNRINLTKKTDTIIMMDSINYAFAPGMSSTTL